MKSISDIITKECVLFDIEKTFSVVGVNGLLDLKQNSPLVLCIDQALRHGLRDPIQGYWQLVRDLTHSTTLKALDACLKYISSSHQKGLLWTYYTLHEGSIEHYITSFLHDSKSLKTYYLDKSLLRDPILSQRLISTISNLRAMAAQMDSLTSSLVSMESTTSDKEQQLDLDPPTQLGNIMAVQLNCKLSTLIDHHHKEFNLQTTSASTPSLTSPVDSGVALLDSDLEATSVSDAVLGSYKVEDFKDDESFSDDWDVLPKQPESVASSVLTQIILCNSPQIEKTCLEQQIKKDNNESIQDINKNSILECKNIDLKLQDKSEKTKILKENVIYRRSRKKKSNKDVGMVKRVSFHEDSDSSLGHKIHSTPKKGYVQGRYSWCGEGDTPFEQEKENFRSKVKSEILERRGSIAIVSLSDSEMGIEADCLSSSSSTIDDNKSNLGNVCQKLNDVVKQSLSIITKKVTDADHYLVSSSLNSKDELHPNTSQIKKNIVISTNSNSKSMVGCKNLPERGAPEGQEDPFNKIVPNLLLDYENFVATNQQLLFSGVNSCDWSSDSERSSDIDPILLRTNRHSLTGGSLHKPSRRGWPPKILNETSSKSSLVNRFLRSIPERKLIPKKKQIQKPLLFIKGAKPIHALNDQILEALGKELCENRPCERLQGEHVTIELKSVLQNSLLVDKNEIIYKVYRVSSLDGLPLLAVLTNTHLYLAGLEVVSNKYCNHHIISLQCLDTVIIGPKSQTLMFVAIERSYHFTVISALGEDMVSDFIAHLELSMRRLGLLQLSVHKLHLVDMASLWRSIVKQTSIDKTEELIDYMWVRLGDTTLNPSFSPLGPSKNGYLMYKPHSNSAWLPGYIILKGGVVYVFNDTKQRLPKHALSLHWDQCGGCRRVPKSPRPHTFEILPSAYRMHLSFSIKKSQTMGFSSCSTYPSFQFAAADDYEASDWLQAIVHSASTISDTDLTFQEDTSDSVIGCELLLTSNHIISLEFPDKVLSYENVHDITSLRVSSTCCIIESSCREIHEGGGDWIIYFLTEQLLSQFLHQLFSLRPELYDMLLPLSDCEPLHSRCEQMSLQLCSAWEPLLKPRVS